MASHCSEQSCAQTGRQGSCEGMVDAAIRRFRGERRSP
jgi:hypothetical protein